MAAAAIFDLATRLEDFEARRWPGLMLLERHDDEQHDISAARDNALRTDYLIVVACAIYADFRSCHDARGTPGRRIESNHRPDRLQWPDYRRWASPPRLASPF